MKVPDNIPTLEQIESIVNKDYRPLTRGQAIKMTYWAFRNELNKEETKKDDDRSPIRKKLMTRPGYSPYCGSDDCKAWPRTKFNGEQFVCPHCGWVSNFPVDFINEYKAKWSIETKKEASDGIRD